MKGSKDCTLFDLSKASSYKNASRDMTSGHYKPLIPYIKWKLHVDQQKVPKISFTRPVWNQAMRKTVFNSYSIRKLKV